MEGLEELLAQLDSLAGIEEEIYKSVEACGEFIRNDARLRAPVDIGDLRKSINHTTEQEDEEVVDTVYTNSDHAVFVEFGTGPVGAANHAGTAPDAGIAYSAQKCRAKIPSLVSDTDTGIRYVEGQAAQPYLYPALKDNEEQLEARLEADIRKALEEKIR